jgi:hypothetical protein
MMVMHMCALQGASGEVACNAPETACVPSGSSDQTTVKSHTRLRAHARVHAHIDSLTLSQLLHAPQLRSVSQDSSSCYDFSIRSQEDCEAAGECTWNSDPSDCEWSNGVCVGTSAHLAETAATLALVNAIAASQCTPGEADCICNVADLEYFVSTEASGEPPDFSQLSSGCLSCVMAGGEDGAEVCFGVGSDGCSAGTNGCVCDASDYTTFQLMMAEQMAAEAAGQPEPDGGVDRLGGACMRCLSTMDTEGGEGDEGPSFDGIDVSVAGLTRMCPAEVEACLADNKCGTLLPTVEHQVNDDEMGMVASLCPSEIADCDATCMEELTVLTSSDDDPDPEVVAGMSAEVQAVVACVMATGLVRASLSLVTRTSCCMDVVGAVCGLTCEPTALCRWMSHHQRVCQPC